MTEKETNPFRDLRISTGMSQRKFAERFGIPRRTVEDWERGINKCAPYLIELIKFRLEHEKKE